MTMTQQSSHVMITLMFKNGETGIVDVGSSTTFYKVISGQVWLIAEEARLMHNALTYQPHFLLVGSKATYVKRDFDPQEAAMIGK